MVRDRILQVLNPTDAAESDPAGDVARYFDGTAPHEDRFTGRLFEQFGGGGDNPAIANRFTADDLVAIEALSVRVPPDTAYEILHGALARDLTGLLAAVPTAIDLGTPGATAHVEGGSAADRAWQMLHQQHGIGWVTAGKLMARKRPRLLPVYDEVVACVLGQPDNVWLTLDEALSDSHVRRLIENLRPANAGHVSTLRLLDVALWMSHREVHRHQDCPQLT